MEKHNFFKSYGFSLVLILSIIVGAALGYCAGDNARILKPFGDIFLNLLFTIVVPLVFFSVSSAITQVRNIRQIGRIMSMMLLVFVVTGIIAAVVMLIGVKCFPPVIDHQFNLAQSVKKENIDIGQLLVKTLTVPDFKELFSKNNMLALILFSFLVGFATNAIGLRAKPVALFLSAGNQVMTKVINYVMLYAPVGLGAYFAYLVGVYGGQVFGTYVRAISLYYPLAIGYMLVAFTIYAWIAGGIKGIKSFWGNIIPPAITAWGTGSGLATLPVNLQAARRIGLPVDVREIVVNVGASIHSDGSSLAAVMKIAILFGIFQMPIDSPGTVVAILAVALLCGTVISGIPSGGMLGELLIITLFGFPMEAMPIITMLGALVDPPATMVNVVGDNICGMLVARFVYGKKWMDKKYE